MRNSTYQMFALMGCGLVVSTALIVATVKKSQKILNARKDIYSEGLKAYQEADCSQAISYFESVEAYASFPFDILDGLTSHARKHTSLCSEFIASNKLASQAKQGGNLSNALLIHHQFIETYEHEEDSLTGKKRDFITGLFASHGVAKLTGFESCNNVKNLIKTKVIPNQDSNLPHFYYHCGKFYAQKGQSAQELEQYYYFLAEFPKHSITKKVQLLAVKNDLICSQASKFQQNQAISQLPNFMPVAYLICAQANYYSIKYPETRDFLSLLKKYYPQHSFYQSANNFLFNVNQEIQLVKTEVYNAGETIKVKLAACQGGSFLGLDWAIDIAEAFSGRSCGLEQELKNWERIATVIPIIDGAKGANKYRKAFSFLQRANNFNSVNQAQQTIQENDQSFFDFLQNREAIALFAHHNPKLNGLVLSRLDNPIEVGKQTQFHAYLK